MLEPYVSEGMLYPPLVALWTSSLAGYLDTRSSVKENDTIVLLPVITAGVQSRNSDLQIGSLIVLSRLTGKVQLSDEALLHLALSVLSKKNVGSADEEKLGALLNTIVLLYETQLSQPPALPKKVVASLAQSSFIVEVLSEVAESYAASKFLDALFETLVKEAQATPEIASMLQNLLAPITCPPQILASGLPALLQASLEMTVVPEPYLDTLSAISQRASQEYLGECQRIKAQSDKAATKKVDSIMASVSGVSLLKLRFTAAAEKSMSAGSFRRQ
jgi:hypothetical protein